MNKPSPILKEIMVGEYDTEERTVTGYCDGCGHELDANRVTVRDYVQGIVARCEWCEHWYTM